MQQTIKPGAIVMYYDQPHLITSAAVFVRNQEIFHAIPIMDYNKLLCNHTAHIIIPTSCHTRGILCLHHEAVINADNLQYIEKIGDNLLTYIMSRLSAIRH